MAAIRPIGKSRCQPHRSAGNCSPSSTLGIIIVLLLFSRRRPFSRWLLWHFCLLTYGEEQKRAPSSPPSPLSRLSEKERERERESRVWRTERCVPAVVNYTHLLRLRLRLVADRGRRISSSSLTYTLRYTTYIEIVFGAVS